MIWTDHDKYYASPSEVWWGQGDIIVAPVAVLDAWPEEGHSNGPSGAFRAQRRMFWPSEEEAGQTTGDASLGPAMILSHGCSLDREWNRKVEKLRRQGYSLKQARAIADEDDGLDRRLAVAPVVPFADAAPTAVADLQGNRVIGFFPVCESEDRHIDGGIVDLSRVATIDRSVIEGRLGILSEDARATLVHALARYWAYRAPKVTYELEKKIGKKIVDVAVSDDQALVVELTLSDGSVLRLLQAPTTEPGGDSDRTALPADD